MCSGILGFSKGWFKVYLRFSHEGLVFDFWCVQSLLKMGLGFSWAVFKVS